MIIGVGSPHGADVAGWEVVKLLQNEFDAETVIAPRQIEFKIAAVPHDALDWLETETITHIVDTRIGGDGTIEIFDVDYSSDELILKPRADDQPSFSEWHELKLSEIASSLLSSSTHQFDLLSVLQLAGTLGRLPSQLILWAVPVSPHSETDDKATLQSNIVACAGRIAGTIRHA